MCVPRKLTVPTPLSDLLIDDTSAVFAMQDFDARTKVLGSSL